jgi:hypothetical protein
MIIPLSCLVSEIMRRSYRLNAAAELTRATSKQWSKAPLRCLIPSAENSSAASWRARQPRPAHPYTSPGFHAVTFAVREASSQLSNANIERFRGAVEPDHLDFLPACSTEVLHRSAPNRDHSVRLRLRDRALRFSHLSPSSPHPYMLFGTRHPRSHPKSCRQQLR